MKLKNLIPNFMRLSGLHNYLGRNKNNIICQLFINNDQIKTEFSITNFVSFYSPNNCDEKSIFKVWLNDKNGKSIASKKISLPKFGSKSINLETLFGKNLPEFGMFLVKYLSPLNIVNKNKELGKPLNSHFYALYHSVNNESLALIHPQQFISKHRYKKTKPYFWISQYIFDTKNVSEIHIYQLNTLESWDMETGTAIMNANNDEIIATHDYFLKSKNVCKSVYNIKEIRDTMPKIKICVKALCGDNAKPLAFFYFDDGSFTATHC